MATTGAGDGVPLVVTSGETMALLATAAPGRLRHAHTLSLLAGGAESNVAIGLARLGLRARWLRDRKSVV